MEIFHFAKNIYILPNFIAINNKVEEFIQSSYAI